MDPGRDRVGQKNKLTYRLARNGSRPPTSHDQRTQPTYLFGAVCPQNAEPVSPSRCLQLHLDEIATKVTPRGHAILILDQACWHGAKRPARPKQHLAPAVAAASRPELNSQENIRQFMRQNRLSNRIFLSFNDIVDHCCYAWNTLIDQSWKISPSLIAIRP
jgi:hypothetical protein